MWILVLSLIAGVLLHDQHPRLVNAWTGGGGSLALVVLLPKLALAALYWIGSAATLRRLGQHGGTRAIRSLDRLTTVYRFAAIGLYGLDIWLGALDRLRHATGGAILIGDILVMLPTLGLVAWGWWAYYPINRRLCEASLIGRIDSGLPVQPIWTRGQYLLSQFRHQVMLFLAPLILLLAWQEAVEAYVSDNQWLGLDMRGVILLAGSGCIFLLAPLMIRHIWDTEPLPAGELHDRLTALCRHHRVGVRRLLLWRTFGGMINAAVMGLVSPVRYILLTDALLEMVPTEEVEAVMAHEIAHIRKHHLFWLVASAVAAIGGFYAAWSSGITHAAGWLGHAPWPLAAETGRVINRGDISDTVATVGMVACAFAALGWVSRSFERQADTFAVQHLAIENAKPQAAGELPPIDANAIEAMTSALQHVADLNHIPVHRRSWRHGSIARRQAYLRSLMGQRVDELTIDRRVGWIKVATAAIITVLVVGHRHWDWLGM